MRRPRSKCIRCGRSVAMGRGQSVLYPHACVGVMPAGLFVLFLHGPTLHTDWLAG